MGRVLVALLIIFFAIWPRPVSAEIIDRILAVVSGQIITRSDVEAALALGLVDARPGPDPISGGLEALVDRVLMLNEVRRVIPPEPPAAAVDARVARIRERFESPAALAKVLAASGIDEKVLRIYAADDLRLASHLAERFSGAVQLSDEEVRQVGEAARQKLADERRQNFIAAWVAELRRRADFRVLP